jgi:hypothetical protein
LSEHSQTEAFDEAAWLEKLKLVKTTEELRELAKGTPVDNSQEEPDEVLRDFLQAR